MNNETLTRMAEYLEDEGDEHGTFDMRVVEKCVLGRACHYFYFAEPRSVPNTRIQSVAKNVFGIEESTSEWHFAFGGNWGYPDMGSSNKRAAAMRLRYLAQHGGAPSRDQWPSFAKVPRPVVQAVEVEEVIMEEPAVV